MTKVDRDRLREMAEAIEVFQCGTSTLGEIWAENREWFGLYEDFDEFQSYWGPLVYRLCARLCDLYGWSPEPESYGTIEIVEELLMGD
jgi:hypothetical protein